MIAEPAVDLLDPIPGGRLFEAVRTVRLGDVDPDGVLRFDALGRYLQDVASDDALSAGLPNALGWVVRRTLIRTAAAAVAGERVRLVTYCTGAGRSWAERRTVVTSERGARIDTVSLWVQIDVATGRPARLGDEFHAVYGDAAGGRRISARLSIPSPSEVPVVARDAANSWRFRRSDLDQFGHVNNAAQLAVVEEHLVGADRSGTIEIEYLVPVGDDVEFAVMVSPADPDTLAWLVQPDGSPATAFRRRPSGQAQPSSSGIGGS